MTNIVIANGPGVLDNGQEVILFPSRWDSGVPGRAPFQFFPYELAYLSALLKRELSDANVVMLDGNLEGWDGDRYIKEIAARKPDVLVCELSALTYPTMTRVMQAQRDCDTILCGPMASYVGAGVDGWSKTVNGEYELDVLELLGGTVPPEARTEAGLVNLDWLPWPEDEDVDRTRYREINHYIDYRTDDAIVQLYATRGCPLSCTFCVVPLYYGGHGKTAKSHRCRDAEDVCDEIEYLAYKYPNFRGNYFHDEAHNANAEWFALFCETLIKRGLNKYQFDAMCGMWTFTRDLVELAARAGYKQIRFGMESTSETVGKAIKKTIHKQKTDTFLRWLKEFGVHAYATVQIGAMGSTEQTDMQTLADVRAWRAAGLLEKWQVSTSVPQPGTPFHQQAKEQGWLITDDINLYDGLRPVISYPHYPAEAIWRVRMSA